MTSQSSHRQNVQEDTIARKMWSAGRSAAYLTRSKPPPSRPFSIHSRSIVCTRCGKKSNPLKLLAIFSATTWTFCVKFYRFTCLSSLQLIDKWLFISFKCDEVIAILAWPISDFRELKNVCAETQQNSVTETTQRFFLNNSILLWCLMSDSHFMWSNCSSSAFVHLFSHSVTVWSF